MVLASETDSWSLILSPIHTRVQLVIVWEVIQAGWGLIDAKKSKNLNKLFHKITDCIEYVSV